MRCFRLFLVVCGFALSAATVQPAVAARATCDDLLSARDTGRSVDEVARSFGTTRARVEACARLAEQRQRHDGQRAELQVQRTERGVAH